MSKRTAEYQISDRDPFGDDVAERDLGINKASSATMAGRKILKPRGLSKMSGTSGGAFGGFAGFGTSNSASTKTDDIGSTGSFSNGVKAASNGFKIAAPPSDSAKSLLTTDKNHKIKALNDNFVEAISAAQVPNSIANFCHLAKKYVEYYENIEKEVQQVSVPAPEPVSAPSSNTFSFKPSVNGATSKHEPTETKEEIATKSDSDSDSENDIKIEGPKFTLSTNPTVKNSPFTFGPKPTKKKDDSDSESEIEIKGPSFQFNKTIKDNVFKFAPSAGKPAEKAEEKKPLSFGKQDATENKLVVEEKKPFSFGAKDSSTPTEKPSISFGSSSSTIKPAFSFGASNPSPQPFSFEAKKAEDPKPLFSFGAKPVSESNTTSSFDFGAKKSDGPVSTFDFKSKSLGSENLAKPFQFNQQKEELTAKPFSFGSSVSKPISFETTASEAKPVSFDPKPVDDTSKLAFGSKPTDGKSAFSFGSKPGDGSVPFSFGSKLDTSAKPFSFGQNKNLSETSTPAFSFGFNSQQSSETKPALFGAKTVSTINEPANDDKEEEEEVVGNFKPVASLSAEKIESSTTGEENEEQLYTKRAKLMLFNPEDKEQPYVNKGLGDLKVLKNKDSGKSRIVVRADGGLRVLLNTLISDKMTYSTIGNGSMVRIPTVNADKKIETFVLKVKTSADGEELLKTLNDAKQ